MEESGKITRQDAGESRRVLSRRRVWAARILGVAADAIQIAFMPLFSEGIASPLNDGLDVVVAVAMIALVG